MINALKLSEQAAHTNFTVDLLENIDMSPSFLCQVCLLDEVIFHVSGFVNRYNCRIWVSQNPHDTCQLERGRPKVSVWAHLTHDKLIGPFLFLEKTVNRRSYLDMLEFCVLLPLLSRTILQQDGAPPLFCLHVRNHLNREILGNGLADVDHLLGLLGYQI
jgi:hypothetical protein